MERKRDGPVPTGEGFNELNGPEEKALQLAPQARHHFTQADQVNQLVGASEANPDLGFMARLLMLCNLPRTNPWRPASVQARQRAVYAHHVLKRGKPSCLSGTCPAYYWPGCARRLYGPKSVSWF